MHLNGSNSRGKAQAEQLPVAPLIGRREALPDGTRKFDFEMASDFVQGREVQEAILGAVNEHKYSDNDIFAIKLALEEAMINAIKHGNRLDPTKRVKIKASVSAEAFDIVIQDEGAGFVRADIPDPTLDENLEKNCGRGIMLIEAYMNEVDWADGGRRLHMMRRRETDLAPKN